MYYIVAGPLGIKRQYQNHLSECILTYIHHNTQVQVGAVVCQHVRCVPSVTDECVYTMLCAYTMMFCNRRCWYSKGTHEQPHHTPNPALTYCSQVNVR